MKFYKQEIKPLILVLGFYHSGNDKLEYFIELSLDKKINSEGHKVCDKINELQMHLLKSVGFFPLDKFKYGQLNDLSYYGWEFFGQTNRFKDGLSNILADSSAEYNISVISNPEICILLSLWREVLSDKKFNPLMLLSVRDPKEVVAHLNKQYGIGRKKALYLWLYYNLAVINNSEGHIKGIISYDNWHDEDKCKEQIEFIAKLLEINDIDVCNTEDERFSGIDSENKEFVASSAVPEWAQNLYQKLVDMSMKTLCEDDFKEIITEFEYWEIMLRYGKEASSGKKGHICIVSPEIDGLTQNSDVGLFYSNLSKILADNSYRVSILYLQSVGVERNNFEFWQGRYAKFGIALHMPSLALMKRISANYLNMKQSFIAYYWLKRRMFDTVYFPDSDGCSYHTLLANQQEEFPQSIFCLNLILPTELRLEANEIYPSLTDSVSIFMEKESLLTADYITSSSKPLTNWIKLKKHNTENIIELDLPVAEGSKQVNCGGSEIDINKIKQTWINFNDNLRFIALEADAFGDNNDAEWPLISICIPTHNRIKLLSQALESVSHLDYPNYEVIIVDDGSDDLKTIKYLNKIEPAILEKGWKLIRQENKYECAARNTAAKHSNGDWFLFMDDDNIALPCELKKFYLVAKKTGSDIVACNIQKFSGDDYPMDWRQPDEFLILLGGAGELGLYNNILSDMNALISRAAFEKIDGFTEDFKLSNGDWEFFVKAWLGNLKITLTPTPLFWYRMSPSGVNAVTNPYKNLRRVFRAYESFLPDKLKGWPLQIYGIYQETFKSIHKSFETQIFWDLSGKFNEERSCKAIIEYDMRREVLITLRLPQSDNIDCYKSIRWDICDSPMYFNCIELGIIDNMNNILWQWDFEEVSALNQINLINIDKGCQIFCTGWDPWMIFLIPENVKKALRKKELIFKVRLMALLNSH